MTTPTWSHGYFPSALYTTGFYRELAPNWLDFAALLKGHRPLRREGEPFTYLELGSGMGLHLCLLAAVYPEGHFVGVDFHMDHIAHSIQLQAGLGLTNLSFLQADFLDLEGSLPESLPPGSFTYVASHGVLSWVTTPVRKALFALSARLCAVGGLVYCSYNTLPGWQAAAIYQHLAERERRHHHPVDAQTAYKRARESLSSLLTLDGTHPTNLAAQHPGLQTVLGNAKTADPHYLLHEYANEGWEPFWVDDVHEAAAALQLRFLGSATLPDLFPSLLPPSLQAVIAEERSISGQELLTDLAANKAFRRDLFVCGFRPLANRELLAAVGALKVRRLRTVARDPASFTTSFGELLGDANACLAFEARLKDGPSTIVELDAISSAGLYNTAMLVALLMHRGDLALDRSCFVDQTPALLATRALLGMVAAGAPYRFLPSPSIGSGLDVDLPQALLLRQELEGSSIADRSKALLSDLETLQQQLLPREGEPDDQAVLANRILQEFQGEARERFAEAGLLINRDRVIK